MKLKLVEERKQPLLSRKDVVYSVEFENACTPSKAEVKKALVAETKAKGDLIVLNTIRTQFGSTTANIEAAVYNDAKALETFAKVHKKKAKGKEGEAAAPAQEAPKIEEKKEETKVEEKKETKDGEEASKE